MKGELGFGIAAATRDGVARLGPAVESLGFAELWANDTRRGSGLTLLTDASAGTDRLRFGVGVVALSDHNPARIAEDARSAAARGLPLDRTTLGVGSGASRSLRLVRAGVAELRELLPDQGIGVAAVGPRMCALAGGAADTVILNWARPELLVRQRGWITEGAERAGRALPRIVAYVRVAVGPDAAQRLRGEMDRYARHSPAYARAFAAQRDAVGVAVDDPRSLRAALLPYRAVLDCCIVRGLPDGDAIDDWLRIAEAAAA